ncbi:MAG: hypothetical protein ABJE47_25995 [bacterium]
MFTTCIHCCRPLGANETIERFPVGEKFAFDSEKGRLWVICNSCTRWNLTPLDERWEAVEDCERLFRAERLRAQTSNIGYAKTRSGVGLVRIGKPLRPEFAAWRYGREFTRRRNRAMLIGGGLAVVATGVLVSSVMLGAAALLLPAGRYGYDLARGYFDPPEDITIPRGGWREWTVSSRETMILPAGTSGWKLKVHHHFGEVEYEGAEARRFLSVLLAHVNEQGASESTITSAIGEVERHPTDEMLRRLARESDAARSEDVLRQRDYDRSHVWSWNVKDRPRTRTGLSQISAPHRLALEMALHESSEQAAIDGDLADLEAAWREAEEIAGIADDLLLPTGVTEFIDKNRRR